MTAKPDPPGAQVRGPLADLTVDAAAADDLIRTVPKWDGDTSPEALAPPSRRVTGERGFSDPKGGGS